MPIAHIKLLSKTVAVRRTEREALRFTRQVRQEPARAPNGRLGVQLSEQIAYPEHVQVDPGIMSAQPGIGHMLESVAYSNLWGDIKAEPYVASKLKKIPEVLARKIRARNNCWADAGLD